MGIRAGHAIYATVEAALWSALEILEERGELLLRMAGRMRDTPRSEQRFRAGADEALERAALIRRALGIGTAGRLADDEPEAATG